MRAKTWKTTAIDFQCCTKCFNNIERKDIKIKNWYWHMLVNSKILYRQIFIVYQEYKNDSINEYVKCDYIFMRSIKF